MSVGNNIKYLRMKYGMTQKELADVARVSEKTVSAWEKDRIIPRMGPIQRMADYFGIRKSDIIEFNINLTDSITAPSLSFDEMNMVKGYRKLNNDSKNLILGLINQMSVANQQIATK